MEPRRSKTQCTHEEDPKKSRARFLGSPLIVAKHQRVRVHVEAFWIGLLLHLHMPPRFERRDDKGREASEQQSVLLCWTLHPTASALDEDVVLAAYTAGKAMKIPYPTYLRLLTPLRLAATQTLQGQRKHQHAQNSQPLQHLVGEVLGLLP